VSVQTEIVATLKPAVCPTVGSFGAVAKVLPRIVYQKASGGDNGHLRGAGPQRYRMQIDCYALDPIAASSMAEAAKVALRARMTVTAIYDNDDSYDEATKIYGSSFDIAAWPVP
jgi:hypothetical protein